MTPDEIIARLVSRHFGSPIVQNDLRGVVVEEIVAAALEPDWTLCSEGWSGWDFENRNGLRLQVKNSAARQSWEGKPSIGKFRIGPAKGYWKDGTQWIEHSGRHAELYVLAWHPITDRSADHRDSDQWLFYVVDARDLPDQHSISQARAHRLWKALPYPELRAAVEAAAERCRVAR